MRSRKTPQAFRNAFEIKSERPKRAQRRRHSDIVFAPQRAIPERWQPASHGRDQAQETCAIENDRLVSTAVVVTETRIVGLPALIASSAMAREMSSSMR